MEDPSKEETNKAVEEAEANTAAHSDEACQRRQEPQRRSRTGFRAKRRTHGCHPMALRSPGQ
eukprot:7372068-Lingulodinium_polyedra.AAC.1